MKKKQPVKEREETIVGYVLPAEWDNEDNVISISISTEDDDYVVELNKLGEELFDFLDEDVEVTGVIREDRDGTKRIRVTNYEVLEETEEDHDEDEDLDYDEDSRADVDLNVVETEDGRYLEVQGTAEGRPFSPEELHRLLALAHDGNRQILVVQSEALRQSGI